MNKLLEAYKLNPTELNRVKLVKYSNKHLMASCLLPLEDQILLKSISQ